MTLLAQCLEKEAKDRSEEETMFIELVLCLFKNLLTIPDATPTMKSGSDHRTRMQNDLILQFHKDNVLELLLVLGEQITDRNNKQWNFILLEFFQLLLKNETAESILSTYFDEMLRRAQRNLASTSSHNSDGVPKPPPSPGKGKLRALLDQEKKVYSPSRSRILKPTFVTTGLTGVGSVSSFTSSMHL
jgi:hypothetical protein